MKLKEILESVDKNLLSEETYGKIEEAFEAAVNSKVDSQVQLQVESALIEMDEDHSTKLENLVKAIDEDHTEKLNTVVESINADHTSKLQDVVKKYEAELTESASKHIETLTEELDKYLDAYVEELIPVNLVENAARNTYATKVLGEAKSVLSVDEKFASSQFREAVRDGAETIETLKEELAHTKNQLGANKAKAFLESKVEALPTAKANFIKKRLSGKPVSFIKENFKFVESLYEEKEDSSDSISNNLQIPTVDRQVGTLEDEIVTESADADSIS